VRDLDFEPVTRCAFVANLNTRLLKFIGRFIANGVEKRLFRDDLDIEVMSESFVGVMFDILRRMLRSRRSRSSVSRTSRRASAGGSR
jgi:hypothetical protein